MPTPLTDDEREDLTAILTEAQMKASAAEYTAAMDSARRAREKDPENIYILAFEKQVEQLVVLATNKALTEESRADILESLGGIIDRAVEVMPGEAPGEGATPKTSVATREDRAAAMEWLKSQYFQQAHQFVRKGEHDHALAEIRRVFIIEPGNETARQFESHIMEIKELHRMVPEEARPPVLSQGLPSQPSSSSPQRPGEPDAAEQTEEGPQRWKRRSGGVIIGVIAIAIAFIGFALVYNWVRSTEAKQEPPPVVIPQPEVFFSDPVVPLDSTRRTGTEQVPSQVGTPDTTTPAATPPASGPQQLP